MYSLMTQSLQRPHTELSGAPHECFKELRQVYNPFILKVFINDLQIIWESFSAHCIILPLQPSWRKVLIFF